MFTFKFFAFLIASKMIPKLWSLSGIHILMWFPPAMTKAVLLEKILKKWPYMTSVAKLQRQCWASTSSRIFHCEEAGSQAVWILEQPRGEVPWGGAEASCQRQAPAGYAPEPSWKWVLQALSSFHMIVAPANIFTQPHERPWARFTLKLLTY